MACSSAEKHFWVTLCIQIGNILKRDSNMKTLLELQATPNHWDGGHPSTHEVVLQHLDDLWPSYFNSKPRPPH